MCKTTLSVDSTTALVVTNDFNEFSFFLEKLHLRNGFQLLHLDLTHSTSQVTYELSIECWKASDYRTNSLCFELFRLVRDTTSSNTHFQPLTSIVTLTVAVTLTVTLVVSPTLNLTVILFETQTWLMFWSCFRIWLALFVTTNQTTTAATTLTESLVVTLTVT